MRIVMFYHSLISDWNHGNAHFLRGVATELVSRGHDVVVYEPENAWSASNMIAEHGQEPIDRFHAAYPSLTGLCYNRINLDLDTVLDGADMVIVHEWNDPELVGRVGKHRAQVGGYRLYFHDTHHRALTDSSLAAYDLSNYDGVLAFGGVIRDMYLARGWAARAWTWHEAADIRVFHPIDEIEAERDLVWIGNWGDDERSSELNEFLMRPARALRLRTSVYGVRYPDSALSALNEAGIVYRGWLANFDVPQVFALHRITVHIPRRPYVTALPGIPTIRVFEALACGIPLISAPWDDAEGLFTPGDDYLVARSTQQMQRHMRDIILDPPLARELSKHGLKTIRDRHTCAHRVDELLQIHASLEADSTCTKA